MLVTIIYNTDFYSEASSLQNDILQEWPDCNINKMGVQSDFTGARYQVQLHTDILYRGQTPQDNSTIINSIRERL
ncbi:MAG: hypothetical protein CBD26_00015 [Candidatus Pelagibacter sp. TMED166]|nr:MAG: hypothetical protein CBD26_00015 [Candidatus Pelagibacter sp. TMED166]|tara:strand:+ start:1395 stop:1619 length:225 start_codon:yes stop_codon:yes gene_type:complete